MNVADVLERAADVIDERGHCVGEYMDRGGSVCVLGAMAVAIGHLSHLEICFAIAASKTIHDAEDALQFALKTRSIPGWSDRTERATVTSSLRACAAVERARATVAEAIPIKVSA